MHRSATAALAALVLTSCAHTPQWTATTTLPALKSDERKMLGDQRIRIVLDSKTFDRVPMEPETDPAVASFYLAKFADTLAGYGVPVVTSNETLVAHLTVRRAFVVDDTCSEEKAPSVADHVIAIILRGRGAQGMGFPCLAAEFVVHLSARRPEATEPSWIAEIRGGSISKDASREARRTIMTRSVLAAAAQLLDDPAVLEKLVQVAKPPAQDPAQGTGRKPLAPAPRPAGTR